MTYEEKLALAAELRKGTQLDSGMSGGFSTVTDTKEPVYVVKGGWKLSVVPEPLPDGPDYSHLNSRGWKTSQKAGRKNGGRKKR